MTAPNNFLDVFFFVCRVSKHDPVLLPYIQKRL